MKQVKPLSAFCMELFEVGFDKRKAKGLVKRANKAGYDIYYAYHEDGPDTWKRGWRSSDYKNNDSDVKIFEATDLIGKSKGGGNFRKGTTYTAECAIFIFCPLNTLMQDEVLREDKIERERATAEKYAIADYTNCIAKKANFEKWHELPEANKAEITRLLEMPGNRAERRARQATINELGGECFPLIDWQIKAVEFPSVAEFIEYKQNIAVERLIREAAEIAE